MFLIFFSSWSAINNLWYTEEVTSYSTASKEGKLILFATILASGMAFLDGSVVNIAIPAIQEKLNATLTGVQWVVNGYVLMLCALILISGALGDRFGRKRIFVYGICLFVFSSLLCGTAHSITQLALFRIVQGIGGAMMAPGSLSIINESFESSVRGKAIGLWSGFAGGVAAIGPFLGGWLVQTLGWSSIFYINVPLGLLALVLTVRYVPESRNISLKSIDLLGAILLFLSLLGITFGLLSGPDQGWTNGIILSSLVGGLVLFVLFILIELKTKEPLVPFSIFKSSLVTGSNIVTLFLYFALSGVMFFLVLNFQQIQHYSPIQAGLAMLPTVLLITFLSGPAGGWADKIGPRNMMIVGPVIVSIGMASFIFPGARANYSLQYLPGLILFGLGMAIVIAPLTKSALSVDQRYSGAASGVNNAVARVAGLLAVALLGAIVLSLFKTDLTNVISHSGMNPLQQQEIMSQENKFAGIEMPHDFTAEEKQVAQTAVNSSFISGFRFSMAVNAALAFLSAVVAFFAIHNTDKKKNKN